MVPKLGTDAINLQLQASAMLGTQSARMVHHGYTDQHLIIVNQTNSLDDRDTIGGDVDGLQPGLEGFYSLMATLGKTIASAADATDQTQQTLGQARPASTATTPDDGSAHLQSAGNVMENKALIAHNGMEIGLMAVLGDAWISTDILQINALQSTALPGQSENSLQEIPLQLAPLAPVASADNLRLSLSVIDGDFLDVVQISQTQVMDDRDVITWQYESTQFQLITGNNMVGNEALYQIQDFGAEVLIIEGDYISQREIVQINLADDRDTVQLLSSDLEEPMVAVSQTHMQNSATIAEPAAHETLDSLPADLALQIADIAAGHSLDQETLKKLDADGDGVVEAMLVRGNYIDVKSIRQSNYLADSDLVLVGANPTDYLEPSLSTIQPTSQDNSLSNKAIIFDATAGARSSYLAGNLYDEKLLLDVNLLGAEGTLASGHAAIGMGMALDSAADLPPTAVIDSIVFDAPLWGH
jgi:hypothetical protein